MLSCYVFYADRLGFYLMGMWYKRSEAQKRFSFFFSSTTLAGAFGGLLAYGLGQMAGMRGYGCWRWVFIIEGCLTAVVAIVLFFFISDFPEDAKWLNEEEREYLRVKLAKDTGKSDTNTKLTIRDIIDVFKDCELRSSCLLGIANNTVDKIFVGSFMYFGQVVTAYGELSGLPLSGC